MRGVVLRDKDVAVRCDRNRIGLEETVGRLAAAGLAQRHQDLAFGTKFKDLHATAVFGGIVGYPDIARSIDGEAIRHLQQATAEMAQHLAVRRKRDHGIEQRAGAAIGAAAVIGPDRAVGGDGDTCRRTPTASIGQRRETHAALKRIGGVVDARRARLSQSGLRPQQGRRDGE